VFTVVRRFIATLAFVAFSCAVPSFAQEPAPHPAVTVIYVPSGESTTLAIPGITRVAVGDSKIAGVVAVGSNELLVNGKAHGHTTVLVWRGAMESSYEIMVSEQRLDDYARVIRNAIDEPNVVVFVAKDAIVVSGTVDDLSRFQRVNDVVARFASLSKDEKFDVVNAVTVSAQLGTLQKSIATVPGLDGVHVDLDGKGNVVVSGSVHDRKTAELALAKAGGVAGAYLSSDGKVIDRLAVDTTTQIGIKVYVLEVDDTGMTQLGLRLQGANPDPSNPGYFILGAPSFVGIEGPGSSAVGAALNVSPFARLTRLAPTLDLIMQSGHAKILSEPNLVTTPGQQATFLVGGEIPYVVSTGLGQVSVSFKEYGVKLNVTPKILGNGSIESVIAPEISDLDLADGVTLNGFTVPAFKVSKLSTDVITQSGESIVMGGLIRHIDQQTLYKIPILGDLPILGKLFRSKAYQHSQSDVVFILSPESIVR
jgi:Flp pilus assembly secretin CpaC